MITKYKYTQKCLVNVMLFTRVAYDFILAIDGLGAITYCVINNGDKGINMYSLIYNIKNIDILIAD